MQVIAKDHVYFPHRRFDIVKDKDLEVARPSCYSGRVGLSSSLIGERVKIRAI